MSTTHSKEKVCLPSRSPQREATLRKHEALLGRQFRRVDNGLDPDDVIDYLETVADSSEAAFKRLEQFSAVQTAAETVTQWIEQAKQMAADAREQAEAEARSEAARRLAEAEQQVEAMLQETEASCLTSLEKTRLSLAEAIDEVLRGSQERIATRMQAIRETIHQARQDEPGKPSSVSEPPADDLAGASPAGDDLATAVEADAEDAETDSSSDSTLLAEEQADLPEADDSAGQTPPPSSAETEAPSQRQDEDVAAAEDQGDAPHLYDGQVTVEIPQSADVLWVRQLRQRILKLPGVYIQKEHDDTQAGATVMHLLLEEPTALSTTLESMPKVVRVVDRSQMRFEPSGRGDSHKVVLKLEFDQDTR